MAFKLIQAALIVGQITGSQIAPATITGSNIAAGTITAGNISAGTVVAGIVNGTLITGAQLQLTGSSGEVLVYSGAPALGNLIVSVSGAAGVDSPGNSFPQGLAVSVGVLQGVAGQLSTLTANPGPILLYGNPNTTTVYLTGAGNWTAPAGVTSVLAEGWGSGAGGGTASGSTGAGGGGGGEYAAEPALAVTPTHNYAYSVGAGGAHDAAGNPTTIAGDSVTVTAHGGSAGLSGGAGGGQGGTGSTNTLHHDGGGGGHSGGNTTGSGGGSSAGTGQAGNPGSVPTRGAAPPGGGGGGTGGNPGAAGQAGNAPGGGGGGSGGSPGGNTGGPGAAGQLRLTYAASGSAVLCASIAAAAGTDPNTSTQYPGPGLGLAAVGTPAALAGFAAAFATAGGHLAYVAANDGNAYDTGRQTRIAAATTALGSTTPVNITGLAFANVAIGTYRLRAFVRATAAASGTVQGFTVRIAGSCTASRVAVNYCQVSNESTSLTYNSGMITALNADSSVVAGTIANSQTTDIWLEGIIIVSAAGTLLLTGRGTLSTSDEGFTAQIGNFVELMPVIS